MPPNQSNCRKKMNLLQNKTGQTVKYNTIQQMKKIIIQQQIHHPCNKKYSVKVSVVSYGTMVSRSVMAHQ